MKQTVQQVVQSKSGALDGGIVVGGGLYTVFSEHLPIIIGILTALLFAFRIYVTWQESKINKRTLEKLNKKD